MNTASTARATGATQTQVSTFVVGKLIFGIDVLRVQEVIRSQKMTKVPLAPPVIEGLINLRGQIVPAIDMRRRIKLEPRSGDTLAMNVIVRTEEGAVSLIVDDIGDVIDLDGNAMESAPDNVSLEAAQLVQAVYKLKDSLLLLLNVDRAIEVGGVSH